MVDIDNKFKPLLSKLGFKKRLNNYEKRYKYLTIIVHPRDPNIITIFGKNKGENERFTIAERYMCETSKELEFLILKNHRVDYLLSPKDIGQ